MSNPEEIHLIYATCESLEQARQIASQLIENRLVACVNLLPEMHSIYEWEGEIQQSQEVVLLAKTTRDQCQLAIEAIVEHHSYDCPAVMAVPLVAGHPGFLNWIADQVQGQ